jgi:hypothetical protein
MSDACRHLGSMPDTRAILTPYVLVPTARDLPTTAADW